MYDGKQLAESFARNLRVIEMQTEGLSHADSLVQAPFRANCLNWVLGHIVVYRDAVLEALGQNSLLTEQQRGQYAHDSQPITEDGPAVVRLVELLALLRGGQQSIAAKLGQLEGEDFDKDLLVGERQTTLGKRLEFLYYHDTYHTGQTEILRQLAGTDDKVI